MRSNIIINKKNGNNKNLTIEDYFEDIFNEILNIKDGIRIDKEGIKYLLFCNDELLCSFKVNCNEELYDYIIDMFFKDSSYHYYGDVNLERLEFNLRDYCYELNDKNYRITKNGYGISAEIIRCNNGIAIEIEEKDIDENIFKVVINNISFEDSLETIFNKLSVLSLNDNIKIKKYKKLNTCDYREQITDLLVIRNSSLEAYQATINKKINGEEINYVLKKDNENYTITILNSSIEGFNHAYFAINEQINFVNQIKGKEKVYSRVKGKK